MEFYRNGYRAGDHVEKFGDFDDAQGPANHRRSDATDDRVYGIIESLVRLCRGVMGRRPFGWGRTQGRRFEVF